jgi:hypothetical protein
MFNGSGFAIDIGENLPSLIRMRQVRPVFIPAGTTAGKEGQPAYRQH